MMRAGHGKFIERFNSLDYCGEEEMKQEKDERTHDMDRVTDDVRCPFCGSFIVKINGFGYYRCKGSYKREFFIAFYNSLRTENPTKENKK